MEIEKYLQSINYLHKEFKELEKERLNPLNPGTLHTETKFEHRYCRDGFHGKKKDLMMRYVYFENMNISNLNVANKTIFNNCIFENVKFKKCKFNEVAFINCKFLNSTITESSLEISLFLNCIGLEDTMLVDNDMENAVIKGSLIVKENLEENLNRVRNIIIDPIEYHDEITIEAIDQEKEDCELKTKNDSNLATLPSEDLEEDMENKNMETQNIISKKTYENEVLKREELENTLFDNCNFISCSFENQIVLSANTDFIKCNFESMTFTSGQYDKVAFDESVFSEVIFEADFVRCNFARCTFHECEVIESSHFFTCNFDFSNAYHEFEKYQDQFTDVIFNTSEENEVLTSDSDEIYDQYIMPLYKYLKTADKSLQDEMANLQQQAELNDDTVDSYLLQLTDYEFMQFISRVTMKRSQESVQKEELNSIDETPITPTGKNVI